MRYESVPLADVAPVKQSKKKIDPNDNVWNITLDQIESNSGFIGDKQFIALSSAPLSTNLVDENNVLYSKLRPYLNKAIIPDTVGVATTELVPLFPDKEKLHNKYLLYYLRSDFFVKWVSEKVSGAKMPRVVMREFWDHKIPLPPLETQKRIVDLLDRAQELIDKRKEQIALMDQLIQSLFYDMFGDPVSNPMGWETIKVSDCIVGKANNGFFGKKDVYTDSGNAGVVWIGDFINKFYCNTSPTRKIEASEKELKQYSIYYGDILFCRSSLNVEGIGKTACVPESDKHLLFECHIIKATLNTKLVVPEFFKVFSDTKFFRSQVMGNAKTATMTTISQDGILKCSLFLPPVQQQQIFFDRIRMIRVQSQAMTHSLKELEDNFNSLIQRAFKGDLYNCI